MATGQSVSIKLVATEQLDVSRMRTLESELEDSNWSLTRHMTSVTNTLEELMIRFSDLTIELL